MPKKNPAAVALGRLGGRAKSEAKTRAVRENAKKPRALKHIESEGQEEGTYWIYLKPGFHNGSGEHAIAADTKREARADLPNVEPCDCEECRELIAKYQSHR